jgi:hypothetical protein
MSRARCHDFCVFPENKTLTTSSMRQLSIVFATRQFARLVDFVDSDEQRSRMEHWIVWMAAGGFVAPRYIRRTP